MKLKHFSPAFVARVLFRPKHQRFESSSQYWKERYARGGNSGPGSYLQFAEFKADVVNALVRGHGILDVIEFGCGDGNQLRYIDYPRYLGLDISTDAVARCASAFSGDPGKSFKLVDDYEGEQAELALSLDVIFHLVEDAAFSEYMHRLFSAATRFVAIYSSNFESPVDERAPHVRHRRFTDWVDRHAPDWRLSMKISSPFPYNGDHRTSTFADFYIYEKQGAP